MAYDRNAPRFILPEGDWTGAILKEAGFREMKDRDTGAVKFRYFATVWSIDVPLQDGSTKKVTRTVKHRYEGLADLQQVFDALGIGGFATFAPQTIACKHNQSGDKVFDNCYLNLPRSGASPAQAAAPVAAAPVAAAPAPAPAPVAAPVAAAPVATTGTGVFPPAEQPAAPAPAAPAVAPPAEVSGIPF